MCYTICDAVLNCSSILISTQVKELKVIGKTDRERVVALLICAMVLLFAGALVAGFTGVMATLWIMPAAICWLSGFTQEEDVGGDNFLFRYLVAEGEKNGLTKAQVHTRVLLVSGAFVLTIPFIWWVAK